MPHTPPPTLGHGLRPVRESDAEALLAAYRSAPDMARQGTVTTLEQARAQVGWLLAEDRRAIAIVDTGAGPGADGTEGADGADGPLVGLVALSIDPENRNG